jgi:putative phage-type endonuclease
MLQRTPEWHAFRLGRVTASRISDVMATIKSGEAITRRNYRAEKVLERISGKSQENNYQSGAMLAGIEREAQARIEYEFDQNCTVEEVGIIPHPTIQWAAASPDGLVGEHGLIEIKCPEASAFLDAMLGKDIPQKYADQMQWQMACSGRQWCDYVLYREGLPLAMLRVERDDKRIAEIEAEVRKFLQEVEDTLEILARR